MDIGMVSEKDLNINLVDSLCQSNEYDPFSPTDADLAQFSYIFDTDNETIPETTQAAPPPLSIPARNSNESSSFDDYGIVGSIGPQPSHNRTILHPQGHNNSPSDLAIRDQVGSAVDIYSTIDSFTTPPAPGSRELRWTTRGRYPHGITYRCQGCRIARKSCSGAPGTACHRCINNYARYVPRSLPNNGLTLPEVLLFHISKTHKLLVNLRELIDKISFEKPGYSLESLFKDAILCHLDDNSGRLVYYSTTSSSIGITRLATTSTARDQTGGATVLPAVNSLKMDEFVYKRSPRSTINRFPETDQTILNQAWLCSYWVRLLLNWDSNQIFLDPFTSQGISRPADAKNILLELMYAIAYRVEELMRRFLNDVISSLQDPSKVPNDMWCISYALLMQSFVNGFHISSGDILRSLEQYRWKASIHCCGQIHERQKLFDQLLQMSKVPQDTLSIAFEFCPEYSHAFNQPTFYSYTCTDILEAKIKFLDNGNRFLDDGNRFLDVGNPFRMMATPSFPPDRPLYGQSLQSWELVNSEWDEHSAVQGTGLCFCEDELIEWPRTLDPDDLY
ncbi:hypothetical protein GGR51DRAFT_558799 [Nemania sp. FL0031]|nr:hypothetical protein GGR51DRAFT_558799 [Nemania sp. FL0031]